MVCCFKSTPSTLRARWLVCAFLLCTVGWRGEIVLQSYAKRKNKNRPITGHKSCTLIGLRSWFDLFAGSIRSGLICFLKSTLFNYNWSGQEVTCVRGWLSILLWHSPSATHNVLIVLPSSHQSGMVIAQVLRN